MKLTNEEIAEARSDPGLEDLNDSLKTPEKFKEIEEKLRLITISDHKHRSVKAFVKCNRCKRKLERRREYLDSVGFKNYEQYIKYRKVMGIIVNKKDIVL